MKKQISKSRNPVRKPFAKKSFGQNFLIDQNYIEKIIHAVNPRKEDTIIEVGPGRGALTEALLSRAGKVAAIELDRDLIPFLQEKFNDRENFQLVESDALKIDFSRFLDESGDKLKLAANLPYYISTAILQRLTEQRLVFSQMVLMFQREVVDRITAPVGNSERGFLTVLTEAYLQTEKLFDIPPAAFRPAPKIYSSVVRMVPNEKVGINDENLFREVISAGFSQKRKTILNNLKKVPANLSDLIKNKGGIAEILAEAEIEPSRRAETLSLEEWKKLVNCLN